MDRDTISRGKRQGYAGAIYARTPLGELSGEFCACSHQTAVDAKRCARDTVVESFGVSAPEVPEAIDEETYGGLIADATRRRETLRKAAVTRRR